MLHREITDKVLNAFFTVYNTLGWGFLESVYQNALLIELKEKGFICDKECHLEIFYKQLLVGTYCADIVVNENVILELKACEKLNANHKYQLINYLKASDLEVGLLLNFGKIPEFKRVIFSNEKVKKKSFPKI